MSKKQRPIPDQPAARWVQLPLALGRISKVPTTAGIFQTLSHRLWRLPACPFVRSAEILLKSSKRAEISENVLEPINFKGSTRARRLLRSPDRGKQSWPSLELRLPLF